MNAIAPSPKIIYAGISIVVNEYIKQRARFRSKGIIFPCWLKDRIHINSKRGVYEVTEVYDSYFVITCQKWKDEFSYGNRKTAFEVYGWSNFKCKKRDAFNRN